MNMNMFMFLKKCGLEILCHYASLRSVTLFLFLSLSKNGQVHCGHLYMLWFGFTCNCVLCQMLIFFCFCSQKVKANLYMTTSMNA